MIYKQNKIKTFLNFNEFDTYKLLAGQMKDYRWTTQGWNILEIFSNLIHWHRSTTIDPVLRISLIDCLLKLKLKLVVTDKVPSLRALANSLISPASVRVNVTSSTINKR